MIFFFPSVRLRTGFNLNFCRSAASFTISSNNNIGMWIWHRNHQHLLVYVGLTADSSIWPFNEINLAAVNSVSSAAQCRCAVRSSRNSDTPPQCPNFTYLDWKKLRFSGKQQHILIGIWLYPIAFLPLILHPCPILFDCLASSYSQCADREVCNCDASGLVLWDLKIHLL